MSSEPRVSEEFEEYLNTLENRWIRTILIAGAILVPLFGILDFFVVPGELLPLFQKMRIGVSGLSILQYIALRKMGRVRYPALQAHFFTLITSGMISAMTFHLGGFESPYYAGLNLVLIGVSLFLPWSPTNTILNSLIVLLLYAGINLFSTAQWEWRHIANNLFFIISTMTIAVIIAYHKYRLTRSEFELRQALWGEMKIATKIQTALLPGKIVIPGYDIASVMIPAAEVGGDYFDIIETEDPNIGWVCIGDVSGHGVTAGLIMMMVQTSIASLIHKNHSLRPSQLLSQANDILIENIHRLGETKYTTIQALRLENRTIRYSGLHQDIFFHQNKKDVTERLKSTGFWIGFKNNIGDSFQDRIIEMNPGDTLLLFTDGVTELTNGEEIMFGEKRLLEEFHSASKKYANAAEILSALLEKIRLFHPEFQDDATLIVLKKTGASG